MNHNHRPAASTFFNSLLVAVFNLLGSVLQAGLAKSFSLAIAGLFASTRKPLAAVYICSYTCARHEKMSAQNGRQPDLEDHR